jgi:phosphate transport system permease protein
MILPTIISISEDAIRQVPRSFREGALALGATQWETLSRTIVPSAKSGILASIILGVGRAIGETMAVVLVVGNVEQMPTSFFAAGEPLTSTILLEMGEALCHHYGTQSRIECLVGQGGWTLWIGIRKTG